MQYISIVQLVLMTIVLIVCGILLWRRRSETGDYSRTIQALFSWLSALFTFMFIFRTWTGTTTVDSTLFEPEHTFVPLLFQMTFFLYPLEVIRSTISRAKLYVYLFTPLLLLFFIGMCAGIQYIPIYTYADLWQHIGEFNVWFRLLTHIIVLFYSFSLFLVPYDWKQTSVSRKLILVYALGFCLIGILHFSIQMTHVYWFALAHQLVWITLFITVAYYELHERLLPPKTKAKPEIGEKKHAETDHLWELIMLSLENDELWRSPELSLTSLAERLDSNRTYVGDSFKRNTGMTFVDYITHRRIDYVVKVLKDDSQADVQELFNYVGYRQRSTARRNFQKITGLTLPEFIEGLK